MCKLKFNSCGLNKVTHSLYRKKNLRSASSNEVYQLTMLYKVWRCQGRILMLFPLHKTLTATCLNSFRVHFLSFYKGWASSEYSFLVSSEKQALISMKFLRKKDVPDYLCICILWDMKNVVTFHTKMPCNFYSILQDRFMHIDFCLHGIW